MSKNRKLITAIFAAFLFLLSLGIFLISISYNNSKSQPMPELTETAANQTINWGLSFPNEGNLPTGNASKSELAKYDAFFLGDETSKDIYLTFDAGYENGYMETILDTLKEKQVPAAFFVVGTYIRDNPDLIRRMVSEGHIVGNHTMNHKNMSEIAERKNFDEELGEVEELYEQVVGRPMAKYYRPPQGVFSLQNLEMAQSLGYKTVFWSLAYVDWNQDKQPECEEAVNTLMKRSHGGMIVLLHSTSKTNALVLSELIDRWKKDGYEFKSLDNL